MAIHVPTQRQGIYFITFTCYCWLPLIGATESYELVHKWFDVLSEKRHTIVGYVLMPNHIHLLLYYSGEKQMLNTLIGNGKRFMAYGVVQRLQEKRAFSLLHG